MTEVYYNEHDAHHVRWLANLADAGLIPAGRIDWRDIQEVKADDVRGYTTCHWFAGVGGWGRALELAEGGIRTSHDTSTTTLFPASESVPSNSERSN